MEPEELARLIDRHADALVLYARQWHDDPEGVVQDAFVALSSRRSAPENPSAWLFRVVRNAAINAGTAARRRRRHEANAAASAPPWFESADASTNLGAIDPVEAEEQLRALPIDQREVIVAHLWGGLTFEQIGGLSGRSSSAAHRLYQSGLNALRARLGVPCPNRRRSQESRPTRD